MVNTLCVFCNVVQDDSAKQAAKLVFETALLESGFVLEDPKDFATRIYSVIKSNLNVSPDAVVEEDEEVEEETEKDRTDNAAEDIPDNLENFKNLNIDQVRYNRSLQYQWLSPQRLLFDFLDLVRNV